MIGKGGKERLVPADWLFFAELVAYLCLECPPGAGYPQCFVVLCSLTAGVIWYTVSPDAAPSASTTASSLESGSRCC
jgi:hypothetical protein